MKVEISYFADPDAKVLVGTCDKIGLATEAPTLNELRKKALAAVCDLLDADPNTVEVSLHAIQNPS